MKKIIMIGFLAVLILAIGIGIGYKINNKEIILGQMPSDNPLTAQLGEQTQREGLIASVKGSLYEGQETATVFGSCLDLSSQPTNSNATLSIFYSNTSLFIAQANMSIISIGEFN